MNDVLAKLAPRDLEVLAERVQSDEFDGVVASFMIRRALGLATREDHKMRRNATLEDPESSLSGSQIIALQALPAGETHTKAADLAGVDERLSIDGWAATRASWLPWPTARPRSWEAPLPGFVLWPPIPLAFWPSCSIRAGRKPAVADPGPVRLADKPEAPGAGHIIEPMLSIHDLATLLSCSRRLVERMRSAGKVPKPDIKIGKMPRWKAATIRARIERGGRPSRLAPPTLAHSAAFCVTRPSTVNWTSWPNPGRQWPYACDQRQLEFPVLPHPKMLPSGDCLWDGMWSSCSSLKAVLSCAWRPRSRGEALTTARDIRPGRPVPSVTIA